MNFDFTLTYNTQDGRDDIFGYGWSMPYNSRLQQYSDDSVSVMLLDGRTYHFTWNGSAYEAPAGVYETLTRTNNGWRLDTPQETRFIFSELSEGVGRMTRLRDRQGNQLNFSYNDNGRMTSMSDDAGRSVTFQYTDGRVSQITDPEGRSYAFTYANGDLTELTDPNNGTRRFQYDERHRMTHLWDQEGIFYLQNFYDDRDRVIEQVDASGVHAYLAYDTTNRVTTFTDNLGKVIRYTYDNRNRITAEEDALGNVTSNEYDGNYNLTTTVDGNGNETRFEYDSRGNMTARYDAIPAGAGYTTDVTRWTYNARNLVTSMTDALGNVWTYQYDSDGNLTQSTAPDGSISITEARSQKPATTLGDSPPVLRMPMGIPPHISTMTMAT